MRRKLTGQAGSAHTDLGGYPNPLLRDCDLRQARLKRWITALLIVMIPFSVWLGASAHADQQQRLKNQTTSTHLVTATTTAVADPASVGLTELDSSGVAVSTTVDSRWVYRGVEHTGRVSVDTGTPAGTTTQIWVGNDGNLSMRPLTPSDVVAASVFTAIGSWMLVSMVLIGFYQLIRFRYDGRRDAEWDREITELLRRH